MMENTVKIYMLKDPITNEVRYIGKTKGSLEDRYWKHTVPSSLKKETNYKNSWIKSLRNKGLKPIIELIEEVLESEWEFKEVFYIAYYKSLGNKLTNLSLGGGGCTGVSRPGYKHTESAKKAIAYKNSIIPKTKEWTDKIAKSNSKPIQQFTKDMQFVKDWNSSTEAAITLVNINAKKNITSCCKFKKKTAYGYIWRYKNMELRDKEPLG